MRIFFRFPEMLLILAILVPPMVIGNTTFDIQLNTTYLAFRNTSWEFSSIAMAINIFPLITWVTHLLARKYNWLPIQWRWAQVVLTLILLTIMSYPMLWIGDSQYVNYNSAAYEKLQRMEHQLFWSILLFLLTQVLFWIIAIIAFIVSLVRHHRIANN